MSDVTRKTVPITRRRIGNGPVRPQLLALLPYMGPIKLARGIFPQNVKILRAFVLDLRTRTKRTDRPDGRQPNNNNNNNSNKKGNKKISKVHQRPDKRRRFLVFGRRRQYTVDNLTFATS